MNSSSLATDRQRLLLDEVAPKRAPGIQYVVVDANQTLYSYAGGWADILNARKMTLDTTMMAYSMTKTFTAAAVLQLVERGQVGLEDGLDRYVAENPYQHAITIRQLLTHTSGIPNPIPLRWVHLASEDAKFDEQAALARVLRQHAKLAFAPGTKFAYSNIGYWLLGQVIERVTGASYCEYTRVNVLAPLGLPPDEMGFEIADPARHARGYLAKWSPMNLVKPLFIDPQFWAGYEGRWLRFNDHYLNGPAFGGLIGTARAFSRFLQDQLCDEPVLFKRGTKRLFAEQQTTRAGSAIPMTLGWHLGDTGGTPYLFKEGGGGGFHSEMRLYPQLGLGTVVLSNSTELNTTGLLNRLDAGFLGGR
jgi:D-alanyl-D-alanine carboxypeptidase